jgi:adenosine deaminase
MDIPALPKVVLHDHLDGGLRPDTVVELAAERGYGDLPTTDPAALADWFDQGRAGSLTGYLQAFVHTLAVMQDAGAIERVAYESLVDAATDGVVHLESRFAPSLLTAGGLDRMQAIEAAAAGFRRAERDTGSTWGIIVDAMRQDTDSEAVAEVAEAARDLGVVGFDLAGPEVGHPASRHRAACERALEAGLGLTIHAGEAAGPDSIADALDCGAQRIGHGYRIIEDCTVSDGVIESLGPVASEVLDRHIPLEICPWSNVHTGGLTMADHPLTQLADAGFVVTIGPDNRLMSRTSASREFSALVQHHGWGPDRIAAATNAAVDAAFVSASERARLADRVGSVTADR